MTGCSEYKVIKFSDCPAQWSNTAQSLSAAAREVLPDLGTGGISPEGLEDGEEAPTESSDELTPDEPVVPEEPILPYPASPSFPDDGASDPSVDGA
ncbi:MAG: hypothetical protein ACKOQ5_07870, partial [Solirubrobacterales bacterium]